MNSIRAHLQTVIDAQPIASTHEHHREDMWHNEMTLHKIFASSYAHWIAPIPESAFDRQRFLEKISGNSYFVWLSRAISRIYDRPPLTADSWDETSAVITDRHAKNPSFHIDMMRRFAGYEIAIQDSFWQPGADSGRPEIFVPTFRINRYVFCHHPEMADHNGNNPWRDGFQPKSFDEYLDLVRRDVETAKKNGAVALKSALAYDRPLNYARAERKMAAKAFNRPPAEIDPRESTAFGDFVMNYLCELAAELDLPFQHHTGTGMIAGSNPMGLDYLIQKHPGTKFVLFHGGYPWIGELTVLAHHYGNVLPDICWLPLISTSAAVRAIREFIEAGINGDRIGWGGDCWSGEESVGAAMALRHALTTAFSQLVEEGYMCVGDAEKYAAGITHANARSIYGLGCPKEEFVGRKLPPTADSRTW